VLFVLMGMKTYCMSCEIVIWRAKFGIVFFLPPAKLIFFQVDLHTWLRNNLDLVDKSLFQVTLFATSLWRIWTRRCRIIFQPDEDDSLETTIANIVATTKEVHAVFLMPITKAQHVASIAWQPPLPKSVKLNTDGAARGNPGLAGAGGVIRNSAGQWLVGFAAHLGVCSNVAAELHALRLGLLLAWQEGYRALICEVDAKVILDLLKSNESPQSGRLSRKGRE